MEKTDDFRKLALLYFNGKINKIDETRLYDFINKDDMHRSLFRQWEQEWLLGRMNSNEADEDWKKLQNKLKDNRKMSVSKGRRRLFTGFKYWAAAVTLIGIITFSYKFISNSFKNDVEKYFVFEAPNGERSKLTLADGTVIWLNSGSTLRCPANFNLNERHINMTGEAYFEVAHQSGSEFIVSTGTCDIVVKGTKFNVTAYTDEDYVQATLIEGKIEFLHDDKKMEMNPGEQVYMEKSSGKLTKNHVNAKQYNAWTEGRIEFDCITLNELLPKLSRHYDVKFHLETDTLANKYLRISIRNDETINEVIAALKQIIPASITTDGKNIYIR